MKNLTDITKRVLKASATYDDNEVADQFLRKKIIKKINQGENIESDEVRFIMDTKSEEELKMSKPKQTSKLKKTEVKPFIKNTKTKPVEIKIDQMPLILVKEKEQALDEQEKNFLKMVEDREKEKFRLRNSGLGYLIGQV